MTIPVPLITGCNRLARSPSIEPRTRSTIDPNSGVSAFARTFESSLLTHRQSVGVADRNRLARRELCLLREFPGASGPLPRHAYQGTAASLRDNSSDDGCAGCACLS